MLWQYNDGLNDSSDALSEAIKNLRYRQFELLVRNGSPNVNARDSCERTPLIMVSIYLTGYDNWYNRERFGRLLLDNRANPNLCDCYGLTPLIHAAINGQADYVKVLLSYDVTNCELCDKAGNTAIMLAAGYGQVQVLRVFTDHLILSERIDAKKYIDLKNNDNKSAQDLAYEANQYECISVINTLREALDNRERHAGKNGVKHNANNNYSHKQSINESLMANTSRFGRQLSDAEANGMPGMASLTRGPVSKSHQNLAISTTKPKAKNGIKLPPINGKRFVEYSDWKQQETDRKTI